MGAPKQKWTAEEETALKAGIRKHGAGKWRTILMDPEFSGILCLRSNVDLKDKWRNMNVMANGMGSRRARPAIKRVQANSNHGANQLALTTVRQSDDEIVDAKPLAIYNGKSQPADSKEPIPRLADLILEAITKLKEPSGSDKDAIAMYIEEAYSSPPNLKKKLSAKLKILTANGKVAKVKHKYRIAPTPTLSEPVGSSPQSPVEENQPGSLKADKGNVKILSKSQIDAELSKMRRMTAQEAAAAAAQAVAEAEAAIAEAEEAAREAEKAEAEAEAAQIFAKAAMTALNCRTLHTW